MPKDATKIPKEGFKPPELMITNMFRDTFGSLGFPPSIRNKPPEQPPKPMQSVEKLGLFRRMGSFFHL